MPLHEASCLETLQHACHCTDIDADRSREFGDAAWRLPMKVSERDALLVADLVNGQSLVSQRSKGGQYRLHLTGDLASIHCIEIESCSPCKVIHRVSPSPG